MLYFISYGDNNYTNSKMRISNEAQNLGFDNIKIYGPEDLSDDFVKKTSPYISHSRGAGYWIWKSFILKNTLESMNDGDICLYADAGCHLNFHGKKRMHEYFEMIKNHESGILSFEITGLTEGMYTNEKVFEYFGVEKDSPYRSTSQLVGGVLFIHKCEMSMRIINEYYEMAQGHPDLFSDLYNDYNRQPEFRDHRHDQSILGYIRKKYGTVVIKDETYAEDFRTLADKPVIAARIRN